MGTRPVYAEAAAALGRCLAARGLTLVYGGSSIGLMRVLADAVLQAGGEVIGVMPRHLVAREVAHRGLTDLRVVGSMHERKALMAELSEAFIALPGGYGTLDEFCEILTWNQLGLQRKPCGILNSQGYYDHLLQLLDHAVTEGFLKGVHRGMLLAETDPSRLLTRLLEFSVPLADKLDRSR